MVLHPLSENEKPENYEAVMAWGKAQELFNEGLALSDKADALFKSKSGG